MVGFRDPLRDGEPEPRASGPTRRIQLYEAVEDPRLIARRDSRPLLQSIACPAIVITGRHDRLIPPDRSMEMADAIPGADLHLLAGCGHSAPIERPEMVNALLRGWLYDRLGVAPALHEHSSGIDAVVLQLYRTVPASTTFSEEKVEAGSPALL